MSRILIFSPFPRFIEILQTFFFFQTRTSLLKVDGVGNVVDEASAKLANSILLFCKGLGWLTSVNLPGVERRASTDSQVQKFLYSFRF